MSRKDWARKNEAVKAQNLLCEKRLLLGASASRKLVVKALVGLFSNCGHSGDMTSCIGLIPTAWPGLTLWLLLSNEASVLAPEL